MGSTRGREGRPQREGSESRASGGQARGAGGGPSSQTGRGSPGPQVAARARTEAQSESSGRTHGQSASEAEVTRPGPPRPASPGEPLPPPSVPSVTSPQHPLSVPPSQPGLRPHLRYARRFRDATRRVPAAARSASRVIRTRSSGPAPSRQFRRLRAAGLGRQWPPVPSAPPCPAARRDPHAAPPPCPLPPLPAQPLPSPRGPALRARSTHFSSVMRWIVPLSARAFWAWPLRAELPRVRPVLALP